MNCRVLMLLAMASPLALSACGHPATVQDCEVIVQRITELELKERNLADSKTVETEVAAAKKSLRDQTMKSCVGRRITDGAMRCVREATTSKQLVEECFD